MGNEAKVNEKEEAGNREKVNRKTGIYEIGVSALLVVRAQTDVAYKRILSKTFNKTCIRLLCSMC